MSVDEDKITIHAVVNAARSYEAARRLREHYWNTLTREGAANKDCTYQKYTDAKKDESESRKLFLSVAYPYLGNCRQGELTACVFGEPFRIDDVIYMIEEHGKKLIRVDLKTTPTLTPGKGNA